MKTTLLFLMLMFTTNSIWAQLNSLSFDFDPSGNQIVRELIHIPNRHSNSIESNSTLEYKLSDVYNDISYYPNPVKEELFVKWINTSEKNVSSIVLYDTSGQLINQFKDLKSQEMLVINFSNYSKGYYYIILIYNNLERKSLKIVKD